MSDERPDELDISRRRAVAMRYDMARDQAPRMIAKGRGKIAERIIELARENNIHVQEDPDLVGLLSQLEVDMEIPEELYRAVAEVLAFVYRVNKRIG